MELLFADHRMATTCSAMKSMRRRYGDARAKRLAVRLQQLRLAPNLAALREVTGRCHELTGDLKGFVALDLDGPYRLLFFAVGDDGERQSGADWESVTSVVIERIDDYH